MMNPTTADLCTRIEAIIQDHIAASRLAAMQTMERAFGKGTDNVPKARRTVSTTKSPAGKRRLKHEIAAFAESLHQAVCATPGTTMTALAAELGMPVKELQRPMAILKTAGRVRSVGERNWTRYFPLSDDTTSTA
jgi:hypothetical protein